MHDPELVIIKTIVRLLLPFVVAFAFYIQFHGEVSPGGGFQSGIILASALIAYSFVTNIKSAQAVISVNFAKLLSVAGVIIYALVGIICMAKTSYFLDYSVLLNNKAMAWQLGIILVEIGVGMAVFGAILTIFYRLA